MLFGLVHRGWPDLRRSRLALPQLVVYEVGAVVLLAGKIMVDATGEPNMLLMTGAPIVIVGEPDVPLAVREESGASDSNASGSRGIGSPAGGGGLRRPLT